MRNSIGIIFANGNTAELKNFFPVESVMCVCWGLFCYVWKFRFYSMNLCPFLFCLSFRDFLGYLVPYSAVCSTPSLSLFPSSPLFSCLYRQYVCFSLRFHSIPSCMFPSPLACKYPRMWHVVHFDCSSFVHLRRRVAEFRAIKTLRRYLNNPGISVELQVATVWTGVL